jgi:hypothetical protein
MIPEIASTRVMSDRASGWMPLWDARDGSGVAQAVWCSAVCRIEQGVWWAVAEGVAIVGSSDGRLGLAMIVVLDM